MLILGLLLAISGLVYAFRWFAEHKFEYLSGVKLLSSWIKIFTNVWFLWALQWFSSSLGFSNTFLSSSAPEGLIFFALWSESDRPSELPAPPLPDHSPRRTT